MIAGCRGRYVRKTAITAPGRCASIACARRPLLRGTAIVPREYLERRIIATRSALWRPDSRRHRALVGVNHFFNLLARRNSCNIAHGDISGCDRRSFVSSLPRD
jgi:hypothetical protein